MPRVRKIQCTPDSMNFFIVDANFLANKYIAVGFAPDIRQTTEFNNVSFGGEK